MPHLIAHIQLASLILETTPDHFFNDFKLDYLLSLSKNTLVYQMIA